MAQYLGWRREGNTQKMDEVKKMDEATKNALGIKTFYWVAVIPTGMYIGSLDGQPQYGEIEEDCIKITAQVVRDNFQELTQADEKLLAVIVSSSPLGIFAQAQEFGLQVLNRQKPFNPPIEVQP